MVNDDLVNLIDFIRTCTSHALEQNVLFGRNGTYPLTTSNLGMKLRLSTTSALGTFRASVQDIRWVVHLPNVWKNDAEPLNLLSGVAKCVHAHVAACVRMRNDLRQCTSQRRNGWTTVMSHLPIHVHNWIGLGDRHPPGV